MGPSVASLPARPAPSLLPAEARLPARLAGPPPPPGALPQLVRPQAMVAGLGGMRQVVVVEARQRVVRRGQAGPQPHGRLQRPLGPLGVGAGHQGPAHHVVQGRLRVGAAIGVFDYERAASLIEKAVDFLVVDSAHGHSANVLDTVREVKRRWDIDVVAGNVATREGARDLVAALTRLREALSGLKCRCGTHVSILRAIKQAQQAMA